MDTPYSFKQYVAFAVWVLIVCIVLGFVLITMVGKAAKNMSRSSLHQSSTAEGRTE